MKKRKQIGRKYNTGGTALSPLSTPSSMPQGASTSSGSSIATKSSTGGGTYKGGGSFDSSKLSSIGNIAGGINNSIGNLYSSDNPYGSFVLGDSTQDPIQRLMGNLTGDNLDTAQTSLNNTVTNVNNNLQGISSSNELLGAWDNISYLDTIEAPTWGERIGDHLLAGVQGANQGMSIGGPWGALVGGIIGNVTNIGSQFAENANRKELNAAIEATNTNMTNNFNNAASNLSLSQNRMAQANYAAYGGNLYNKYRNNPFNPYNLPIYQDGGTLQAIGQHGGEFSNGITKYGSGGTHEQNPLGGIPVGMDAQGVPNLVEEGEVRFKDYIFSDRLKVDNPDFIGLPKSFKKKSYAKAAEYLQKESQERPYDPISQNGLEVSMIKLQGSQEELKMKKDKNKQINPNMFSDGGIVKREPEIYHNFEFMPTNEFYTPTYMSAVDKLKTDDHYFQKFLERLNSGKWGDTGSNSGKWTIDNRQDIIDRAIDNKKGPIHNLLNTFDSEYNTYLKPLSPLQTYSAEATVANNSTPSLKPLQGTPTEFKDKTDWSFLRYAPAIGGGISVLSDALGLTNKPDYTNSDMIGNAADNIGKARYKPIGNYLTYNPVDENHLLNQILGSSRATDRNIIRSANGNRSAAMTGLLANNYNTTRGIGDSYLKATQQNLDQLMNIENFNRGTNQMNSQMFLQTELANKDINKFKVQAAMQEAQMRDVIGNRASAAKSANLSNFMTSLGNIGIDATNRNDRDWMIKQGLFGGMSDEDLQYFGFDMNERLKYNKDKTKTNG